MLQKIKKSKLGFTLIEMLVVIAIIAILVSVIMPMASNSMTKASAATNAANLRAVEGAVTALYLQNPEKFVSGDITNGVMDRINYYIQIADEVCRALFWYVWDNDTFAALRNQWVQEQTKDLTKILNSVTTATFYADENGEIHFEDLVVKAPASKAIVLDGFTIRKGIQMAVTVGDGGIVATYDGLTSGAFAVIAEGNSDSSGAVSEHAFRDSNADGECDICGPSHNKDWDDEIYDDLEQEFGGVHSCSDKDNDGDHICDADNCNLTASGCNTGGAGYTCSECGKPHTCSHTGSAWAGRKCSICNERQNNCPYCD